MPTNIASVQAAVAYASSETANGQQQTGSDTIERADKDRKALQRKIKESEVKLQDLQAKLMEQKDDATGFWGGVKSFFGDDSGVGATGDALSKEGAEMKKAARELELKTTEIEGMLRELQSSQQEFGNRLSDHRKTFNEHNRAVQIAGS